MMVSHLTEHGYFILTYPPATSLQSGADNKLLSTIHDITSSLSELFTSSASPWPPRACSTLGSVYFNEKDVPMYKLGYDDGTGGVSGNDRDEIREYFRVASQNAGTCGSVGDMGDGARDAVVRGLNLSRYITDVILSTTLGVKLTARHGNAASSFTSPSPSVKERAGDYSLLYAMNYYNSPESIEWAKGEEMYGSDGRLLVLKEHVDPSLVVLEPIISRGVGGLEVFDAGAKEWILVDGGHSAVHDVVEGIEGVGGKGMVVFVGKAFASCYSEKGDDGAPVEATLHRCVAPRSEEVGVNRRAIIFEQKYAEFMTTSV